MPRLKFIGFIIITAAFLLLLLSLNQRPIYHKSNHSYLNPIQEEEARNNTHKPTIKEIIDQQFNFIQQEAWNYQFPPNTNLNNFTMTSGGQPLRNIIITTWRSGSTFLGDVLNAVPGTFYHYEPLLDYGIVQIRGPPYGKSAVENLKHLLNCNYKELVNYLDYGQSHIYLFTHNTRLWEVCEMYPHYCWNYEFLTDFCKLFPFQSMKVVRLRLKIAEKLLQDES